VFGLERQFGRDRGVVNMIWNRAFVSKLLESKYSGDAIFMLRYYRRIGDEFFNFVSRHPNFSLFLDFEISVKLPYFCSGKRPASLFDELKIISYTSGIKTGVKLCFGVRTTTYCNYRSKKWLYLFLGIFVRKYNEFAIYVLRLFDNIV